MDLPGTRTDSLAFPVRVGELVRVTDGRTLGREPLR